MMALWMHLWLGLGQAAEPVVARPVPLVGVTGALALPMTRDKPVGFSYGVQTIVPYKRARFSAEVFCATPTTAFNPAIGGDLGAGLVNGAGVGGAVAVYAKSTLPTDEADAVLQVGPGVMMTWKVAPTVIFTTPLVVWIDPKTGAVAPSLSLKAVLGIPYAK